MSFTLLASYLLSTLSFHTLLKQVIWTLIQRFLNVMDVRWTLKQRCVLTGNFLGFTVFFNDQMVMIACLALYTDRILSQSEIYKMSYVF